MSTDEATATSDAPTTATATADASGDAPNAFDRAPWWIVPSLLLGIPALLGLGSLVAPRIFYDKIVWPYYWGPIKADAARRVLEHNGVLAEPGYNTVNTLSWVVLMGLCVFGLAQLLRHHRVKMDNTMIVAATSWVAAGAIWHVLQDTELIAKPLEYFFITPPIYLLFAAGGVASILLALHMRRVAAEQDLDAAVERLGLAVSLPVILYTLAATLDWWQVTRYLNPILVAVVSAVFFFIARARIAVTNDVRPADLTLIMAGIPFVLSLLYVARFIREPWSHVNDNALPAASIVAPALAGALTGVIYLVAKTLHNRSGNDFTAALSSPINMLLIFSQMVDGFATSLGVDLAGYGEKHVLSARVIDAFRDFSIEQGFQFGATYPTFLAFAPLKLAVAVAVVIAIDVYSKEDVQKRPELIGLFRFAVIMVGIGPGMRNFVRLSLGV